MPPARLFKSLKCRMAPGRSPAGLFLEWSVAGGPASPGAADSPSDLRQSWSCTTIFYSPIPEGHQIGQAGFPLREAVLAVTKPGVVVRVPQLAFQENVLQGFLQAQGCRGEPLQRGAFKPRARGKAASKSLSSERPQPRREPPAPGRPCPGAGSSEPHPFPKAWFLRVPQLFLWEKQSARA